MNGTTHCFVDVGGKVSVKDGAAVDQCVGAAERLMKVAEAEECGGESARRRTRTGVSGRPGRDRKAGHRGLHRDDPCLESGSTVE